MFINGKMNKEIEVHSYSGMQLSKKKKKKGWITNTHNNMSDSHRYYPEPKNEIVYLYYYLIYIMF